MGSKSVEKKYLDQIGKRYSTTNIDTGSAYDNKMEKNTSSSLPESCRINESLIYENILSLTSENKQLNQRLEACEEKITEYQNKFDSIEKMCNAVSNFSKLLHTISITIIIFIIGIVLVIFYINRAGIVFDAAVAILGLLSLINIKPIWNIPKKIEEIEKEIKELKAESKK